MHPNTIPLSLPPRAPPPGGNLADQWDRGSQKATLTKHMLPHTPPQPINRNEAGKDAATAVEKVAGSAIVSVTEEEAPWRHRAAGKKKRRRLSIELFLVAQAAIE